MEQNNQIVAVVPAAGVGSRMQASKPKQYLKINDKTILEHSVYRLLAHERIAKVVVVIGAEDSYFAKTSLANHQDIVITLGGKERADSVLAGLQAAQSEWVMVHDAARPCVRLSDINRLIDTAMNATDGAILAIPARDTIKQADTDGIVATIDRNHIWQAMTPQMFKREQLMCAMQQAQQQNLLVTDEASAIELMGGKPKLVAAHSSNIKVTLPEDLALAAFLLTQNEE